MAGDLNQRVTDIMCVHPQVRSVRLAGSRARGTATAHSDWDFQVDAADFPTGTSGTASPDISSARAATVSVAAGRPPADLASPSAGTGHIAADRR
jgi:hypothetical protein